MGGSHELVGWPRQLVMVYPNPQLERSYYSSWFDGSRSQSAQTPTQLSRNAHIASCCGVPATPEPRKLDFGALKAHSRAKATPDWPAQNLLHHLFQLIWGRRVQPRVLQVLSCDLYFLFGFGGYGSLLCCSLLKLRSSTPPTTTQSSNPKAVS